MPRRAFDPPPGNVAAGYDTEMRQLIGADLLITDDFERG
jgi:hypothetical protein